MQRLNGIGPFAVFRRLTGDNYASRVFAPFWQHGINLFRKHHFKRSLDPWFSIFTIELKNPNLDRYGIIGYPLGHSFSRRYFTEKFEREGIGDSRYDEFPLPDIQDFPDLLAAHPDLRGLNVTIPYKQAVMPYLAALDDTARAVGAVNTILVENNGCTGFNTDVIGLELSLQQLDGGRWLSPQPEHTALILGTGGASRAVAYVLGKYGISYRFVSRKAGANTQLLYSDLEQLPFESIRWIFNATPVGTYPDVDVCPDLPYHKIHAAQLVYDLVYNPAETLLLQRARAQGATVKNGLEMLHLQAEAAWAVWQKKINGTDLPFSLTNSSRI